MKKSFSSRISISFAVTIGLFLIYVIIILIMSRRGISLGAEDGSLVIAGMAAADGIANVCFSTSMFRKNMGTGVKKAFIILISIACLIFVIYSIYCLITNQGIYLIGFLIAAALCISTYMLFPYPKQTEDISDGEKRGGGVI